jgi:Flp pilus assembly pilin Flp
LQEQGTGYPHTEGAGTVWHKIHRKEGQNLVEYAIVVSVVAAAMLAMSTYVFRSVQATQRVIQEGLTD